MVIMVLKMHLDLIISKINIYMIANEDKGTSGCVRIKS